MERPRVPRSKRPPNQRPYCAWIGTSNPSIRSIALRSVGFCTPNPSPAIVSKRLPGRKRTERKTSRVNKKKVGISSNTLRIIYALISVLVHRCRDIAFSRGYTPKSGHFVIPDYDQESRGRYPESRIRQFFLATMWPNCLSARG